MKKWKWDTPYRSVYVFDMTHFHGKLKVGKANVLDLLLRSVTCPGPRGIVVYDKQRPIPARLLAYLERIGLRAYAYIGVQAGEGSLFQRLMADEAAKATLRAIQEEDGISLLLKPYISTLDAWRFAKHMGMRYFFGPQIQSVKKLSNKATVRLLLQDADLQLPITEGMICTGASVIRIFAEPLLRQGRTVVIKENLLHGASADGFTICSTQEQLDTFLNLSYRGGEVIVERWYEKTSSPSMIFEVRQGHVRALYDTEQILEKTGKYIGNTIPSELTPLQRGAAKRFGKALGRRVFSRYGYEGVFGIDFIVVTGRGLLITEVNFRFTGSYFLWAAKERLEERWFRRWVDGQVSKDPEFIPTEKDRKQFEGVAYCTILKGLEDFDYDYDDVQTSIDAFYPNMKQQQAVIPHNVHCYRQEEGGLIVLAQTKKEAGELCGKVLAPLHRRKHGSLEPQKLESSVRRLTLSANIV